MAAIFEKTRNYDDAERMLQTVAREFIADCRVDNKPIEFADYIKYLCEVFA